MYTSLKERKDLGNQPGPGVEQSVKNDLTQSVEETVSAPLLLINRSLSPGENCFTMGASWDFILFSLHLVLIHC